MIRIFGALLILALAYNVTMSPIDSPSSISNSHQISTLNKDNNEIAKLIKLYMQIRQNAFENEMDGGDNDDEDEETNDDEANAYMKRSAPRRIFIGKRYFSAGRGGSDDDDESYVDKRANIHRVFIGKRKLAHDIKRIFIG
jgi:hypothetical protein